LIEALDHASPAIRRAAAGWLTRPQVDATPWLVHAVSQSDDLAAVRAAVVLMDRLRPAAKAADGPARPKLGRDDLRPLTSLVREAAGPVEPWRWYLAVYLLDKLDPAVVRELLPELRMALRSGQPMKQYAAVQALFRLGADGRAAEEDLWSLLYSKPCFRGLFIADRVLDDQAVAYTEEIGVYDLQLGLKRDQSYVTAELLVLKTLYLVGASHDRLTGALANLAWHESQDVRLDVVRQLGVLRNSEAKRMAAGVLIRLIYEPDSLLRRMLAEEEEDIRKEAVGLFTQLGPAAVETVPTLAELLSASENGVRLSAAAALGEIGPPASSALEALERALRFEELRDSEDSQIMKDAIDSIQGKPKKL
jgi:hypothetical protein